MFYVYHPLQKLRVPHAFSLNKSLKSFYHPISISSKIMSQYLENQLHSLSFIYSTVLFSRMRRSFTIQGIIFVLHSSRKMPEQLWFETWENSFSCIISMECRSLCRSLGCVNVTEIQFWEKPLTLEWRQVAFCFWFSTNYRQLDIWDLRIQKQMETLHDQLAFSYLQNQFWFKTSL